MKRGTRAEQNKKVFGNEEDVYAKDVNSDELLNKHQFKKIFRQTFDQETKSKHVAPSKKVRLSEKEYHAIRIKDRYSAEKVAHLVRLDSKKNRTDRIRFDWTPYLLLPIQCIGKKGIYWITCIAPTQSAKTTFLQVFVADSIDQAPGNMLYVMPTGKTAERGYNDKIVSMIENTPMLYEHVIQPKDDNLLKTLTRLDNMCIFPVTAGSLSELSSITCSRIAIDELRLMDLTIGAESNVIKLTEDRLTVFLADGLGQGASVSSASSEDDLLFLQTLKPDTVVLHWYTECKFCHKMQVLDFFINMFIDPETKLPRANEDIECSPVNTCHCKFCGAIFDDDDHKIELNKTGKYGVKGLDGILIDDFPEPPLDRYVIFWWSSMNSPFRSFDDIYKSYKSALVSDSDMINFYIAWCARFLKKSAAKYSVNLLKERVNDLPRSMIPDWTKVITCGVDTQDMNFYYVCEAWGNVHQSHIFDYGTLYSNIHEETKESVHDIFEELENRVYLTEDGVQWAIGLIAVDMGGHKTKVMHSALKGLRKTIKCFGRGKVDGIKFSTSGNNCYFVNTDQFLTTVDNRPYSKTFSIFNGEHTEFFRQFFNKIRVDKEGAFGVKITVWDTRGAFDYKMALVHSNIALNVGVGKKDNTFFNKLSSPSFSYNPVFLINQTKEEKVDVEKVNFQNKVLNRKNSFTPGGFSM